MWRTIGFLLYFWPLLHAATIIFLPILILMLLGSARLAERIINEATALWSRHMLWMLGARVTVQGQENLPRGGRICVVSNHQGYGDSLLIQGYLGVTVGFVAKKELAGIPPLSLWMRSIHTVFVRRGDRVQARHALAKAARNIVAGHPMAVFPESTRSRGGPIGRFKGGALRIGWDSHAIIVPVTVSGTADLFERQGYLRTAAVRLVIHPPLYPTDYRRFTRPDLADRLRETIASAL